MPEDWEEGGFGLYVHWPFCQSKCPYCDFNSHVAAAVDQDRWAAAYEHEIERVGALTGGRILRSVFFGGGTPSLMQVGTVDRILRKVRATWGVVNDLEVTLEANPTSVEAGRFTGYREAGVSRVSLGVQALVDSDLKALGRLHDADEARAAFATARGIFDRVSFDLIYARQNQSPEAWEAELVEALSMGSDHLSLYQLTIEDGTAFGDRFAAGKLAGLPDEDRAAEMFEMTQAMTSAAGFSAYEVSNHARDGQEGRHNLVYWRGGDYAGIGPGAHGRLTLNGVREATVAEAAPAAWLAMVEGAGDGTRSVDRLDNEDRLSEFLMMGLRLSDGVSRTRLETLSGGLLEQRIIDLEELGLIARDETSLRVTARGRPVLNAVLRKLLT
ncbi:MAG: coproporphyrinogen III oxidase [Rubellimicrobium sp.]|nr:coproporphyrinogen III oxidase [Rubellimicrobium sp.]